MLGRDMMSDKLENLISAHTRLMADISHELRSPLARLTLASAVARRTYDTEGHLSLDRVDRETERMTELVSQLTSLSQLDLASAELSCESVDINELVDSIAESTAFEAREKNCTLVKSNDNTTEIFVEGDRELLRRMVENVVRNATRYTMPNTRIDVRVNTIDSGKNVRIMVLDRGPGVPNNELEEIFRPFYRTSLARDRQSGGVGLGLAIAQRAAAKHDGTISASNRTDGNGGLSVCITLPCVTFAC
jgi:two-component system sensor histidine kinase CpxA